MRRSRAVPAAPSVRSTGPAAPSIDGSESLTAAPPTDVARLHGLERTDGCIRARLQINGGEHLITYRFAGFEPDDRYEGFAVAATPIAMRVGLPLSVPSSLSPRLMRTLPTAQQILHAWYPELRPIEIRAAGEMPASADGRGVACFFSAGVDSFYSVLRHRDRLDALIYVHGFDVPLAHRPRRDQVSRTVRRAAAELELPLVEVETDLRAASNRYAAWGTHYNGVGLASVALFASTRFREILIPASHSYRDLLPWGSHPLLDPLWSTEAVELVHDAPLPRPEKLRLVANSDVAMRHLRVCFHHDASELNCGHCEKCLRTMAGLRIAGALERCETFAEGLSLRKLAWAPVPWEGTMAFTLENFAAAKEVGDRELVRALWWMQRLGPLRARLDRVVAATSLAVRRARTRIRRGRRRLRRRVAERIPATTRAAARSRRFRRRLGRRLRRVRRDRRPRA
jgi:hypothetical protein